MKFDHITRSNIVAALDYLASNPTFEAEIAEAVRILNFILANQEDWRPERWSMEDYSG